MRNVQGIIFYMNTNIWGDIQICISLPLTFYLHILQGLSSYYQLA